MCYVERNDYICTACTENVEKYILCVVRNRFRISLQRTELFIAKTNAGITKHCINYFMKLCSVVSLFLSC
jgi:hypothetical protein